MKSSYRKKKAYIKVKKCILCVRTLLTVLQCVCFEWLQNFESMILTLIFYGTAQTLGSSLAQLLPYLYRWDLTLTLGSTVTLTLAWPTNPNPSVDFC